MRQSKSHLLLPAAALFIYLALALFSSRWMALTFDELGHQVAGMAVSREGDFRFGPNHPPLIRYWFSLPNSMDPGVVFPAHEAAYREGSQFTLGNHFLNGNDYLKLIRRSRLMVILLAVTLGGIIWWGSRRILGKAAATAALFLFVLEPNLMAHGSLASTDMGITLFFALTVLALRKVYLRLTLASALALSVLFAVAQLSKFSAIALWPALAAVLLARVIDRSPWPVGRGDGSRMIEGRARRTAAAAGIVLLLLVVFLIAAWGAYQFRYAMAPDPSLSVDFREDKHFGASEKAVGWMLGSIRFLPEGYVRGVAQLFTWPHERYYVAGRLRSDPVWWFFPLVLLVKTPTALLLLAVIGIWLFARRRHLRPEGWQALAIPPLVFLLAAILSGQSTGIRHLLPIFPFLMLAAGFAASRLLANAPGKAAVALLAFLMVVEFSLAYPDIIAAFNLPSGGPAHGDRWLVDSNMDYGQGMLALKEWLDERGIREINLACHTMVRLPSDQYDEYDLPGHTNRSVIRAPRLPGYVALSSSVARGYTLPREYAGFYAPFQRMKPVAVIGNSIRIYRVEKPWWEGK